uniref:uncharacterized protein LOC100185617 isoform X2 n=1 Tax=Ciona intestinalis TaxID=7719 RepID=UPI0005217964|nr:uncharacterized protein LOC100185617 isoform X2 [Ciona intestinalis]|eukprot:XP_009859537.1 uncharacterized protein LOC100185617 isoform X2 [Ciona intestinalis]
MASANAKTFPTVIVTGLPVNDHVEKSLRNCIDQTIGPTNVVKIEQLGGSYVVAVTDNKYCYALRGADLVVSYRGKKYVPNVKPGQRMRNPSLNDQDVSEFKQRTRYSSGGNKFAFDSIPTAVLIYVHKSKVHIAQMKRALQEYGDANVIKEGKVVKVEVTCHQPCSYNEVEEAVDEFFDQFSDENEKFPINDLKQALQKQPQIFEASPSDKSSHLKYFVDTGYVRITGLSGAVQHRMKQIKKAMKGREAEIRSSTQSPSSTKQQHGLLEFKYDQEKSIIQFVRKEKRFLNDLNLLMNQNMATVESIKDDKAVYFLVRSKGNPTKQQRKDGKFEGNLRQILDKFFSNFLTVKKVFDVEILKQQKKLNRPFFDQKTPGLFVQVYEDTGTVIATGLKQVVMDFIQGLNAVMPANSQSFSVVQPQSVPEHNSSFDFNVKDKQVLRFVGYSSKYKEELESLSDDGYKVKVVIKESKITIKVTPLEEEAENQANVELTEFFSHFSSKVVKLEKDKVKSIKARLPAILQYERGGDVYMQERENNNKIDITLSGIKEEVEMKVKQINKAADFETKTERFPHFVYRAIIACGLYEDVQRLCGDVEISLQDPISSLEYCGPSHKVEEATCHLKRMVQNLHEETPEFSTEIKSFLAGVLQLEDSNLEENLLQLLQSDLKATFSLPDGELHIIAKSQSIFNQYCDVIKDKIVTCELVDQNLEKLQQMKEIQHFGKLRINGKLLLVIFKKEYVQITGEKSLVLAWKSKIESDLAQLQQCSHEIMLTKHARDFVMNVWDSSMKSKVVIQEIRDQIQVKGMVDDVTLVVKRMKLLEKQIKIKTKVYKKHGCVHYFQSPNAKTMLKSVGAKAKVGISWIKCSATVQVQPQVSSIQKFGGIEVAAMSGDITKHVCDMVVNSAPTNYELNKGELSRAIIAAGGQQVAQECLNPIVSSKNYRVTSGGQLPCKYICHLVVPSHQPDLELAVFKILRRGHKLGVSSVAFPSLGTGGRGLPPDMVVTSIVEGILKFSTNYPSTSIGKVGLVHFNQNEVPLSLSIIESKVSNNPVAEIVEFIEVKITGETNENIRVGEARLDKLLEGKITTEQLHQNDLNQLSHLELNEINSFAEKIPDVKITVQVAKQTIDIEGTSEKVKDVKMEVVGYLKSLETATISYKLFQWQYCDNTGKWNNYPKMASYKIEQGAQGSVLSVPTKAGTHFVNKQNKMFQMNSTVGKIRKMSTDHKDFPEHWAPMGGESLLKAKLNDESDEYKRICKLFHASSNGGMIVQIDRIQKPVLYRQYAAMREEVRSHVTADHLVERELFHGTTLDVYEQILNTGFNRSYAGKNGTMLGNGVYFSTTSSYSDRYAKQTPLTGRKSLTKIMFVASVLTGEYTKGNRDLKEPPNKPGTSHTYDSVVDNVANPTMFAVFKDASVYPSYLISYL